MFIRNGYPYGNDLPELLAQLMAGKGIKFGYASVTVGAATLQLRQDGKSLALLINLSSVTTIGIDDV
ncbi:hypothetical protein [Spirosoma flavum]|uniref:Uncharacterized protein n=1 Tax=Spirosoma flavum TaxID=2048557 RepID=A0ABW6AJQ3_9BACT